MFRTLTLILALFTASVASAQITPAEALDLVETYLRDTQRFTISHDITQQDDGHIRVENIVLSRPDLAASSDIAWASFTALGDGSVLIEIAPNIQTRDARGTRPLLRSILFDRLQVMLSGTPYASIWAMAPSDLRFTLRPENDAALQDAPLDVQFSALAANYDSTTRHITAAFDGMSVDLDLHRFDEAPASPNTPQFITANAGAGAVDLEIITPPNRDAAPDATSMFGPDGLGLEFTANYEFNEIEVDITYPDQTAYRWNAGYFRQAVQMRNGGVGGAMEARQWAVLHLAGKIPFDASGDLFSFDFSPFTPSADGISPPSDMAVDIENLVLSARTWALLDPTGNVQPGVINLSGAMTQTTPDSGEFATQFQAQYLDYALRLGGEVTIDDQPEPTFDLAGEAQNLATLLRVLSAARIIETEAYFGGFGLLGALAGPAGNLDDMTFTIEGRRGGGLAINGEESAFPF